MVQVTAVPDGSHQAVLAGSLQLAGSGHEARGPLLLPNHLLHLLPQPLLTAFVPAPHQHHFKWSAWWLASPVADLKGDTADSTGTSGKQQGTTHVFSLGDLPRGSTFVVLLQAYRLLTHHRHSPFMQYINVDMLSVLQYKPDPLLETAGVLKSTEYPRPLRGIIRGQSRVDPGCENLGILREGQSRLRSRASHQGDGLRS